MGISTNPHRRGQSRLTSIKDYFYFITDIGGASKAQQIAECGFDLRHLGGSEFAHAACQFALIETGKALHIHRRMFGQLTRFTQIHLAPHPADLGSQRRHDGEGTGILVTGKCQNQHRTAFLHHAEFGKPNFSGFGISRRREPPAIRWLVVREKERPEGEW